MAKKLFACLGIVVLFFIFYVNVQPTDYFIVRAIQIDAPAKTIFPWVNDSEKMFQWMPWMKIDPAMKVAYAGPKQGLGAESIWTSTGPMGVGSAEIIESMPNQVVTTILEYQKPFRATQIGKISIIPQNNVSVVTWSVSGENDFKGRLRSVFENMDKMVGTEFEKGLKNLKTIAEAKPVVENKK